MGRTTETGNAVNLSNCKLLIDTCACFGIGYSPGNINLTITNMMARWTAGAISQKAYITALESIRQPVSARKKLFTGIVPLLTRVLGELSSNTADAQLKAEVKTIADELRGNPAPAAKKNKHNTITIVISQTHTGYVQRANYFYKLIELLKAIPEYAPKKDFIKIAALTTIHANMEATNNSIGAALNIANDALLRRNHALYTPETGIVATALACKEYIKGHYGTDSTEYRMVNKINFRNLG